MVTLIDNRLGADLGGRPRHPEKVGRPDAPAAAQAGVDPHPAAIRLRLYAKHATSSARTGFIRSCEEAGCPNIGECWQQRHATMMIMGGICTRACAFCNVATGLPQPLDTAEPRNVADAVAEARASPMWSSRPWIAMISLTEELLHFARRSIEAIRASSPSTTIEVLIPDFLRKDGATELVVAAAPDVLNHNLETVPSLYLRIRPGARYFHLAAPAAAARRNSLLSCSRSPGSMVGLGETRDEILQVMDDLRSAGVDFLTIGQYLAPSRKHAGGEALYAAGGVRGTEARRACQGLLVVASSSMTRSSYHAGDDFVRLRSAPAYCRTPERGFAVAEFPHPAPRSLHRRSRCLTSSPTCRALSRNSCRFVKVSSAFEPHEYARGHGAHRHDGRRLQGHPRELHHARCGGRPSSRSTSPISTGRSAISTTSGGSKPQTAALTVHFLSTTRSDRRCSRSSSERRSTKRCAATRKRSRRARAVYGRPASTVVPSALSR